MSPPRCGDFHKRRKKEREIRGRKASAAPHRNAQGVRACRAPTVSVRIPSPLPRAPARGPRDVTLTFVRTFFGAKLRTFSPQTGHCVPSLVSSKGIPGLPKYRTRFDRPSVLPPPHPLVHCFSGSCSFFNLVLHGGPAPPSPPAARLWPSYITPALPQAFSVLSSPRPSTSSPRDPPHGSSPRGPPQGRCQCGAVTPCG